MKVITITSVKHKGVVVPPNREIELSGKDLEMAIERRFVAEPKDVGDRSTPLRRLEESNPPPKYEDNVTEADESEGGVVFKKDPGEVTNKKKKK